MTWVAWYPWLAELMTHTAILWELSFAALIWVRPLRPVVLAIGILLHVGIGAAMGMWTFGLIMIFGHVAFWPVTWVQRVVGWIPGRAVATDVRIHSRTGVFESSSACANPAAVTPGSPKKYAPALLCVGGGQRRRLACLGYFMERGFRCTATDSAAEAQALRDAASPDAVVVLGANMDDDEIRKLHAQHLDAQCSVPLFLILTSDQSDRLNGHMAAPNSHVITGTVRLGLLRQHIEQSLDRRHSESKTEQTVKPAPPESHS